MKRTERGWVIYTKLKDTYGNECRVQESSSAEARRVWIFSMPSDEWKKRYGEGSNTSAHLSPAQARRVAEALLRFAAGK